MRKLLAAILLLVSLPALAQFTPGQVLTAAQLNSQFALYVPLAGATLTGPLTAPTLTVTGTLNAGTFAASSFSTANATITGGSVSNTAISGSTVDGTPVGSSVPAAGFFSGLTSPTLTMSGNLPAGSLGLLTIQNPQTTATTAGQTMGIKVCACNGTETSWLINPSAGDWVAGYFYANSNANRNRIWAINPIVDVQGTDATAWIAEFDINNMIGNAPNPGNVLAKYGLSITSGGAYAPSAAISIGGTNTSNAWKHGIWFNYTGYQSGSTLIHANPNVSVDYGLDLSQGTINYQGVRIGPTPSTQVAAVATVQPANGSATLFLQRNTDTSPTGSLITAVNNANSTVLYNIDASGNETAQAGTFASLTSNGQLAVNYSNPRLIVNDTSGTNSAGVQLRNNGTTEWNLQNSSSSNGFSIARYVGGTSTDTPISISNSTGLVTLTDGFSSTAASSLSYANPRFGVNDTSGTSAAGFQFQSNATTAWGFKNTSSTGTLTIDRYVSGTNTDSPVSISNSTGVVSFVDGITVSGVTVYGDLRGTSSSIGGSALAAGACSSTTVTVTGATTSMAVNTTPVTYPGAGFYWRGYVSSANTVTAEVCAATAGTPTASTYNVRVLQ